MKTQNKVVFITGATKNTGFAIARKFAMEGYNVLISSRDAELAIKASERLMTEYPDIKAEGYGLNPSNTTEIMEVFESIYAHFGRIDSFIANAAHLGIGMSILNTTPQQYDEVMNVNAKGYFFCSQEAAKIMIKNGGGSIVLVGSVHANGAIPERIVYAMSKSAISALNRNIAIELAKYNIRCNCLIAGAIWSDRWDKLPEDEIHTKRSRYPLGKESMPEDIANAVFFLASDQCPTVTGTEFVVDSGVSICLLPYDKEWDKK